MLGRESSVAIADLAAQMLGFKPDFHKIRANQRNAVFDIEIDNRVRATRAKQRAADQSEAAARRPIRLVVLFLAQISAIDACSSLEHCAFIDTRVNECISGFVYRSASSNFLIFPLLSFIPI